MNATERNRHLLLLVSTFVVAICGLIYELIAAAMSSYLLGDSVTQFSLVIGVFLAAMGLGSFLSRYITRDLPTVFVQLQMLVGLVGGLTALILFWVFARVGNFNVFLFGLLIINGTLAGLEVPLIMRLLKDYWNVRVNLSNVLTADYAGALIASIAFPLVLAPQLGLIRTGLLFGLLNLGVAVLVWYSFRREIQRHKPIAVFVVCSVFLLLMAFINAERITRWAELSIYRSDIIHAETTPYQRIVITSNGPAVSMYLNGGLQFNSIDEYRYHESLVHPAMSISPTTEKVLVLGGGDGMAVREVLKHDSVQAITLVDLDPAITTLFSENDSLASLSDHALRDAKVNVINGDAWQFVASNTELFDVIIIDLPDPKDVAISKLYTNVFYELVLKRLSATGVIVTQSTSPLFGREAFWSINATLKDTGLHTLPYHTYVPSFGEWGFIAASRRPISRFASRQSLELPSGLRFLNADNFRAMTYFPADMDALLVEVNTIEDHSLVQYYESGWSAWHRE